MTPAVTQELFASFRSSIEYPLQLNGPRKNAMTFNVCKQAAAAKPHALRRKAWICLPVADVCRASLQLLPGSTAAPSLGATNGCCLPYAP